ncbi:hypothetical protein [Bifidobacterium castoris]|uniref:Alpha-amylase n=1 Tax=Bifidobacterium castoris TaxID=2306972 RepID=A0A430FAW4_9BIFI|nr:hypothetical protein [Bifidobacterium castoris]RSX49980.1 alpha-amylase [Bifidobacterium castoris]
MDELTAYLHDCGHCMTLFDVALHFRFEQASKNPDGFDLRGLDAGTLHGREPAYACTFVDNHDTQPGQSLESWVSPWFKPLAYAYILLRDCAMPCVFLGDYYGIPHDRIPPMPLLRRMVWIRAHLLGDDVARQPGDTAHSLCWVVGGGHPVCVVLNTGQVAVEREVRDAALATRTLVDVCHPQASADVDVNGRGLLRCPAGACAVYIDAGDYEGMRAALGEG